MCEIFKFCRHYQHYLHYLHAGCVLLLLLLLHLLDHSRCNCEKLRFHNNGIVMMNLLVTAALGSGCTQPSLEYPEYPEFLMYILFCLHFHSEFNSQVISICSLWYAVQSYISGWFNTRLWRFLRIFSDSSIVELSIPTYNSNYTVSTGIYRTMYYIYVNHLITFTFLIVVS